MQVDACAQAEGCGPTGIRTDSERDSATKKAKKERQRKGGTRASDIIRTK